MNESYYLQPKDHHKSFYKKAVVELHPYWETLFSYGLEIIRKTTDGDLIAIAKPDEISATTLRHIKAFCGIDFPAYKELYIEQKSIVNLEQISKIRKTKLAKY